METNQKISELRSMFVQLSSLIVEEMKKGKTLNELSETLEVLKRIQSELEKLEHEKKNRLN